MEMKFSEKFKKNKSEAVETETAQDFGKKKHKPDPKKLVGTISKKHIKNSRWGKTIRQHIIHSKTRQQNSIFSRQ